MRVGDLYAATLIVNRLSAIKSNLAVLALNSKSGGVRIDDNAQTWVEARRPETREAIKRLLVAELKSEEAALRRQAAQIGLQL